MKKSTLLSVIALVIVVGVVVYTKTNNYQELPVDAITEAIEPTADEQQALASVGARLDAGVDAQTKQFTQVRSGDDIGSIESDINESDYNNLDAGSNIAY